MNEPKLIEMLHSEIGKLDDKEVVKFREALKHELPQAIRKAAKKAKINGKGEK